MLFFKNCYCMLGGGHGDYLPWVTKSPATLLISTLLYQKTWGMLSQLDYHNIFLFSVCNMSTYV
jgi:hypothetical protein